MKCGRSNYDQIQDASGKIPEDEPVFLLRATDPLAAEVIRHWIYLAEIKGARLDILATAASQADAMENWPIKNKVADL